MNKYHLGGAALLFLYGITRLAVSQSLTAVNENFFTQLLCLLVASAAAYFSCTILAFQCSVGDWYWQTIVMSLTKGAQILLALLGATTVAVCFCVLVEEGLPDLINWFKIFLW